MSNTPTYQYVSGLYKARRPENGSWGRLGCVSHHAIHEYTDDGRVVVHERVAEHEGLLSRPLEPGEHWQIESRIQDEDAARRRLTEVKRWGSYNVCNRNCEHATNYIAAGIATSTQVRVVIAIAIGLVAVASVVMGKGRPVHPTA